jgi:hypothetical protein
MASPNNNGLPYVLVSITRTQNRITTTVTGFEAFGIRGDVLERALHRHNPVNDATFNRPASNTITLEGNRLDAVRTVLEQGFRINERQIQVESRTAHRRPAELGSESGFCDCLWALCSCFRRMTPPENQETLIQTPPTDQVGNGGNPPAPDPVLSPEPLRPQHQTVPEAPPYRNDPQVNPFPAPAPDAPLLIELDFPVVDAQVTSADDMQPASESIPAMAEHVQSSVLGHDVDRPAELEPISDTGERFVSPIGINVIDTSVEAPWVPPIPPAEYFVQTSAMPDEEALADSSFPPEPNWVPETRAFYRRSLLERGQHDCPENEIPAIQENYAGNVKLYVRDLRAHILKEWGDAQRDRESLTMVRQTLRFEHQNYGHPPSPGEGIDWTTTFCRSDLRPEKDPDENGVDWNKCISRGDRVMSHGMTMKMKIPTTVCEVRSSVSRDHRSRFFFDFQEAGTHQIMTT